MALILTVLSYKGQVLAQPLTATIGKTGGTIGRSDTNSLVLPDNERFVSRQHATISLKNDGYYLTDSSLSGIYIDNQPQALHNSSTQIFDGTHLKIGEYEITVSIVEDEPLLADFPFPSTPPQQPQPPLLPDNDAILFSSSANSSLLDAKEPAYLRHEDLFSQNTNSFADDFESQLEKNRSPIFDSYIPPAMVKPSSTVEEIPENLSIDDLFSDAAPISVPNIDVKTPLPQQAMLSSAHHEAYHAFLSGAAITELNLPPPRINEAMQRVGQMFRKLVAGTVALLRSRAEFKSLLRVNMTIIRTSNNNPLKFAVSTDEVIKQLLENKAGAFLEATSAVDEGFNDIMNHQLAMQAGIQASLTDLLRHFDPALIEQEFEQGLVLQKKSKCWDKYTVIYQEMVDNAVENFFSDAFIQAYEAQMKALLARRK